MLPGAFPTEDLPEDETYFSRMEDIVRLCESNNIAVIISLYNHYLSE